MKDFQPLNANGRGMPQPRRPLVSQPMSHSLYQVHVETSGGATFPVGPKMAKPMAEKFLVAINMQISKGNEREWKNPHLVHVKPL